MYKITAALESYTDLELALMVLLDVFGTGSRRKKALGSRYYSVQELVNEMNKSGEIKPSLSVFPVEKIRAVFDEQRPTDQEYQEYVDAFIYALRRR